MGLEVPEPLMVVDDALDKKTCRRSWAQLIYQVYEIDPLKCPKCGAQMPACRQTGRSSLSSRSGRRSSVSCGTSGYGRLRIPNLLLSQPGALRSILKCCGNNLIKNVVEY
ncbi:MAG: hypothetical protein MUP22_02410 [Desulfobacterales bacterium]|nr:hypothetical protein [Desulfobacterales bacterium]